MAKYQSFPGEPGSSDSLEKLKSLKLPDLSGKTILDIGCNSGFFSGYAYFSGAAEIDAVDYSENFINEAKKRFLGCNFFVANFEELPKKKYDCILFLSAIHYAADQEQLIHSIIKNNLGDDGILVLEMGLVSENTSPRWFQIERGIDTRLFCNMSMLQKILQPYAWKIVSQSVNQKGDPTPRFTIHIRHKKKFAILLLKPPGFGKTTISQSIFNKDIPIINLDSVLLKIEQKKIFSSERLYWAIKNNFSALNLGAKYQLIGDLKLYYELINLALNGHEKNDVIFDGAIPGTYINEFKNILLEKSYFPIELEWKNVNIPDSIFSNAQATLYFDSLSISSKKIYKPSGRIDKIENRGDGILVLTGWAINANGTYPDDLQFNVFQKKLELIKINKLERSDVKSHLGLTELNIGFKIEARLPKSIFKKNESFSVSLVMGDFEFDSKLFSN